MSTRFSAWILLVSSIATQPIQAQSQAIGGGEYFFDVDPGQGAGMAVTAPAAAGAASSFQVPASAVQGLAAGVHTFSLRWKAADGAWGTPATVCFVKLSADEFLPSDLSSGEYFVDTDPGAGQATPVPISAGHSSTMNSFIVSGSVLASVADGVHALSIRWRDSKGAWSAPATTAFVKSGESVESVKLDRLEWEWWIGSDAASRRPGGSVPLSAQSPVGNVTWRLPGSSLAVGQSVTVRAWWVAADGARGIPVQQSWQVKAHEEAWKGHYFSPSEIANPAVSGFMADPDNDGVPNLLELAFGHNPREGEGSVLRRNTSGTEEIFTFDFERLLGGTTNPDGSYTAGRYNYRVEKLTFSQNGASTWSPLSPSGMVQTTWASQSAGFEGARVTVPIVAGPHPGLFRVVLTVVP